MDTILNTLKAGLPRDQLSLRYYETLNNLVAYDNDLRYSNEQDNNSEKLPTLLSCNPSQYEKDLRNLVLDLYSDRDPSLQENEPRDMITMDKRAGVQISSSVPTPSYEIVNLQSSLENPAGPSIDGSYLNGNIRNPPILYRYEETALTSEGPQQTGPSSSLTTDKPELNDCSITSTDVTRDDLCHDFQENLSMIDVKEGQEATRHHCESTVSEFITPSFSDSGIQLESYVEDCNVSEIDSGDKPECNDNRKRYHIPFTLSTREVLSYERDTVEGSASVPMAFIATSSPIRNHLKSSINNQDEKAYVCDQKKVGPFKGRITTVESELRLALANMEGKLEEMTIEYTSVLEERKVLQDELKLYQQKARINEEHDPSHLTKMQHELENLRDRGSSMENTIAHLQESNDDKDLKINDVEENLRTSQLCIQNLHETLNSLEEQVSTKGNDVEALEKDLLALNTALEESRLQYEESIQEKTVLSSDVSTLMNAKSFLMKQLEISKETQVQLKLELSEYESTVLAKNKQVEVLKCDNARVVQALTKTQDQAIKEKASILEHLEKVESDLVNQDVSFRKMQLEKSTVQRELAIKIESLEKENILLQSLAKSVQELEKELEKLKLDGQSKENMLELLQKEKTHVTQQLTQARSVNEVCEKSIKSLSFKLQENEIKLENLLEDQATKDVAIQELKNKNATLIESIRESQEEKDSLDSAVQMLRHELDKVERRFKMMKRELTLKSNQLDEVTKRKDTFAIELRSLREELEQHKVLMENLRDAIRHRDEAIQTLQNDKAKLNAEALGLSESLKKSQMALDESHKDKQTLYEQLQSSNSDLLKAEKKVFDSSSEKAKLEGEFESAKRAFEDYANIKQVEYESIKHELSQLQSAFQYETTRHRDEAINLKQEIELMKGQLVKKREQHKKEVAILEKKFAEMAETKTQENTKMRKNCEDLVIAASEKLERERSEMTLRLSTINQENECLSIKYTELEKRARNTALMQQNRINDLEKELELAKKVIADQKHELEKRLLLSVELEREKGRLAGLKTSQKTLREHCANVEKLSAKRESTISELQTKLENVLLEKDKENKEAQSNINHLEETLKKQGERIDELRMRLNSERQEGSQLKTKLCESEQEAEYILKKLTKTRVELENCNSKYETSVKEIEQSKKCQQELRSKLQTSQMIIPRLENELKILKERERLKDDITQSLDWKLSQRSKELDYAKDQLRLSDERHQSEIETLKTAIQVSNTEAAYLRREVSLARKSKCENQEKYFTSRDELLAARQETEIAKQDLFAASQQLRYLKSAILNSRDVTTLQEFVRNDNEVSFITKVTLESPNQDGAAEFKSSLGSLRDCMATLRIQISTLQEQMNSHTDAICTTASSWRSFEKNVKHLQTECATVQRKAQMWSAEKDISARPNKIISE